MAGSGYCVRRVRRRFADVQDRLLADRAGASRSKSWPPQVGHLRSWSIICCTCRRQHPETRGRIALVNGAGGGIGRATTIGLMSDGFGVVLAGRRAEPLLAAAADAAEKSQQVLAVRRMSVTPRVCRPCLTRSSTASSAMPGVPTAEEQGRKGYDANTNGGFLAPAGTRAAIVAELCHRSAGAADISVPASAAPSRVKGGRSPASANP